MYSHSVEINYTTLVALLDAIVSLFIKTNQPLCINNLENSIQTLDCTSFEKEFKTLQIATIPNISIKHFLIEILENLGLQILFSGKGIGEKAVIIDYLPSHIDRLGIVSDHFKFGQTIIKNSSDKKIVNFVPNTEEFLPFLEFATQYIRKQITFRNPLNLLC